LPSLKERLLQATIQWRRFAIERLDASEMFSVRRKFSLGNERQLSKSLDWRQRLREEGSTGNALRGKLLVTLLDYP